MWQNEKPINVLQDKLQFIRNTHTCILSISGRRLCQSLLGT